MITTNEPTGRRAWYRMGIDATVAELGVDTSTGLSSAEVSERTTRYGRNVLAAKKPESALQAFLRQYQDLMQIILVGAAIVNQIVTGEPGTTIVLIGLTVFNAVLGLRQEAKAEASLAALQKMLKDIARVRRDGVAVEIDAAELVPGDIVLFEAGNRVPADGRLLRRRHAGDRRGRPHRRERPGPEGHGDDRPATTSARRPPVHWRS